MRRQFHLIRPPRLHHRLALNEGHTGTVVEVLTTGALVQLAGATMAVPWGERVEKSGRSGRLTPGAGTGDPELIERLKRWRLEQARSHGVSAYVVFNDETLEALAELRPATSEALLEISGIGPAKLDVFGDELLDVLSGL